MSVFGHTGSSPAPFDAVDGHRLAGSAWDHPLHGIAVEELVRPGDGPIAGVFTLDAQPRVGEGITGTVRLRAGQRVAARGAALRLVGLKLVEQKKSRSNTDGQGHVTSTEEWVEANGELFIHDAFPEPAIPAGLEPGQEWEARFAVPAPPLGPPTAHLGEAIVAWALEVRWDIPHGTDHFVAVNLPLAQHPDLLRAGVGKQGGTSLFDTVSVDGATIHVSTPLPAPAGSEIGIVVSWPGAPSGRGARVELHRHTNVPNGQEATIASAPVAIDALKAGTTEARLVIPPGSAPSFDGAGLEIRYVIRVLVDRAFRADAAIERPVGLS